MHLEIPLDQIRNRKAVIRRKGDELSSEIIGFRSARFQGRTFYDTRHPSISKMILEHFYGFDLEGARLDKPEDFLEDLAAIMEANIEGAIRKFGSENTKNDNIYSIKLVKSIVSKEFISEYPWFPKVVFTEIITHLVRLYGNESKYWLLVRLSQILKNIDKSEQLIGNGNNLLFDQLLESAAELEKPE